MEKQYRVLLQDENEGTWDQVHTGDFSECVVLVESELKEEDDMGLIKVEEVKSNESFTKQELHIMYFALVGYYNELIDEAWGESDLIQRYMDEQKAVVSKLERLVK